MKKSERRKANQGKSKEGRNSPRSSCGCWAENAPKASPCKTEYQSKGSCCSNKDHF